MNERRVKGWVAVCWLLACAAVPLWIAMDHVGWDVAIYHNAIRSLQQGHDPYADAIAVQDAFHRTLAMHPHAVTPFSYVYSPMTLPLLRVIGAMPVALAGAVYWLVYVLGGLCLVWVGMQAAKPSERRVVQFVAPAALFFPGMLQHDAILSGNVAVILYALVLGAAMIGWRRGEWRWCYLAILVASCFKAPLLTLLAVPLFSARRQWMPAGLTAAAGVLLFAVQPLLWPSLFHNFLHAVGLQFTYNRDFGCSPAGLISEALMAHGMAYSPASTVVYLAYAVPLFAAMWWRSRRFLAGRVAFEQWMPVLLVGTILLNPRIMQYDVLPLTLPMGLIAWRVLRRVVSLRWAVVLMGVGLAVANGVAVRDSGPWKQVEGVLLMVVFVAGWWGCENAAALAER